MALCNTILLLHNDYDADSSKLIVVPFTTDHTNDGDDDGGVFLFGFHSKATDMFEKFRLWIDDPTLCGRPAAPPGTKVMSQLGVVMCLAGTLLLTSILLLYETFFLEPLLCPHFKKKKKRGR